LLVIAVMVIGSSSSAPATKPRQQGKQAESIDVV
jgi:hypothetical protein